MAHPNQKYPDCYHKHCVIDEDLVYLEVLDTAGQDDYTYAPCQYLEAEFIDYLSSALRQQWMRHGQGFLIVYSITSRESFEEVSVFHQQILRVKDQDSYPVVIVGNKCDLEYERQVGMHGAFILATPGSRKTVDFGWHDGRGSRTRRATPLSVH